MAATRTRTPKACTSSLWGWWPHLLLMVPAGLVAVLLFRTDGFDPAPLPDYHSWFSSLPVPARNDHVLRGMERLADGHVAGPEDLAYSANGHHLYTGCADGWIKRLKLSETVESVSVENWTYIGGRPIGLSIGADNQLIVADAFKGLLRVAKEGGVETLTDGAEGVKFGLTNCVNIAGDGMIYFTDTSYKYKLGEHKMEFLEGKPHGRLMSFDPSTKQTQVLVRDLYFANGVALSPANDFLVFCETILRRCRKYHIQGDKKGTVDNFIDNLPGFPDNIHFDGEDLFWIAFPSSRTFPLYLMVRYPFLRKVAAILERFVKVPEMSWKSGVLGVSLEGKPVALYTDPALFGITSGVKIGRYLYFGSLVKDYISRLDLTTHPARAM
ncbi:hypothetical protein MRB53_034220 [Persea americana]|uniref:Uncharacterized protein n=1 Tax=Persea americana TaxID=3435 RepID=A0ACC2KX78_PERAE|nr:hypothetical protein MRB53_034220 [Persea americana]